MTNIFATPEKRALKRKLFAAAEMALANKGWKVERVARAGKSSLRRITRKGESKLVAIRTTQNTWIAFPRNRANDGWATLEDVDYVVAASVDDRYNAKAANIHFIPAAEMTSRFDRAYSARKKADYAVPRGRGIWISLYDEEASKPVTLAGAGAGLRNPPIESVPLANLTRSVDADDEIGDEAQENVGNIEPPLTITEAKRRLAESFGVTVDQVTITISS